MHAEHKAAEALSVHDSLGPVRSGRVVGRFQPLLIAIVGGSGAGKSWLATQLQARLGKEATRLSLDDFYRDRVHLALSRKQRINFDHPRAIDWPLFEKVLARCKAGRGSEIPRYDFSRHARRPQLDPWSPRPIVLIEGLWLLRRPAVRRLFDLSLFVNCSPALRLRRRLARDQAVRGRLAAEVKHQFRCQVLPMHQRFVAPQARLATRLVRSPLPTRNLDRLEQWVRQQCGTR
jgi:uridine kinase